jgi:hypothetical protein
VGVIAHTTGALLRRRGRARTQAPRGIRGAITTLRGARALFAAWAPRGAARVARKGRGARGSGHLAAEEIGPEVRLPGAQRSAASGGARRAARGRTHLPLQFTLQAAGLLQNGGLRTARRARLLTRTQAARLQRARHQGRARLARGAMQGHRHRLACEAYHLPAGSPSQQDCKQPFRVQLVREEGRDVSG